MADEESDQTCKSNEPSNVIVATVGKRDSISECSNPIPKKAGNEDSVDILVKPTGDAPIMKNRKWTVKTDRDIGSISTFMKKYLKMEPQESLFLYVNQAFAPSPDQTVKTLYECFGSDGKLVLHYCKSQAWG